MKRSPDHYTRWLAVAAMFRAAIVVLFMLIGYWPIQQDDSYIFYSYARNLANGYGYVFNIGERVNATMSPLYTILLAAGLTTPKIIDHALERDFGYWIHHYQPDYLMLKTSQPNEIESILCEDWFKAKSTILKEIKS